jgi:hypothetical protein
MQNKGGTPEESDIVFSFCEKIGLPTTLVDALRKNTFTTKLVKSHPKKFLTQYWWQMQLENIGN